VFKDKMPSVIGRSGVRPQPKRHGDLYDDQYLYQSTDLEMIDSKDQQHQTTSISRLVKSEQPKM
jgi:hypothetical protein